jgi:hypothetical protein
MVKAFFLACELQFTSAKYFVAQARFQPFLPNAAVAAKSSQTGSSFKSQTG